MSTQLSKYRYPLWSWSDAAIIVAVFFGVYLLSIPLQFGVAELTGEMDTFRQSENPSIPPSALLINHIAKAISLVGAIIFIGIQKKHYTWQQLGFKPTTRRWVMLAIIIGIANIPLRLILARLVIWLEPALEDGAGGIFLNNDYGIAFNLVLLIIISTVVPISEELFYRGFLFTWFRNRHPLWMAVMFSSFMFGVSHLVPIQILMSIVLSIVITLVYEHTRSLWNAIIIHAVNNFVGAGLALLLSGTGFSL